jgi:hypothetical protein
MKAPTEAVVILRSVAEFVLARRHKSGDKSLLSLLALSSHLLASQG